MLKNLLKHVGWGLLFLLGGFFSIILTLFILSKIIFANPQADLNAENLEKITVGMNKMSVIKIMGQPTRVDESGIKWDEYTMIYNSPFGYSADFEIRISLDSNLVTGIYKGL